VHVRASHYPDGVTTDKAPLSEAVPRTHVDRLRLRNYRSVRECDVSLRPGVTFLVGPNGSGKSNILDCLRLMSEAQTKGLNQAVRERGGFREIRRKGPGKRLVSVEVDITLAASRASYAVDLDEAGRNSFSVVREECRIAPDGPGQPAWFRIEDRHVTSSEQVLPAPAADRLYLVAAANLAQFRPVYDAFFGMAFYNLNPAVMRAPQVGDSGELLLRDGGNAASVLRRVTEVSPEAKRAIDEFLAVIVPGVERVDAETVASLEVLRFEQNFPDLNRPTRFYGESMSDGTLRALGVLLAVFQPGTPEAALDLVGIEEPEAAIHAAAAAVLRDALLEAGEHRQVVVTTHSAELLDDPDLDPASILAVEAVRPGVTVVGQPDRAGLSALKDHLFTAGELLRVNQLMPTTGAAGGQS
jgi:predicted ATPase